MFVRSCGSVCGFAAVSVSTVPSTSHRPINDLLSTSLRSKTFLCSQSFRLGRQGAIRQIDEQSLSTYIAVDGLFYVHICIIPPCISYYNYMYETCIVQVCAPAVAVAASDMVGSQSCAYQDVCVRVCVLYVLCCLHVTYTAAVVVL